MVSHPSRSHLLGELKRYLLFLKDAGFDEIPVQAHLETSSVAVQTQKFKRSADEADSPPASADKPPEPEDPLMADGLFPATPIRPGAAGLQEIQAEMGDCTRCKLCQGRQNIVFGSGNPEADLMFIGEGPGADEDAQGLPFVGRAGKKLTDIIEKGMGLSREKEAYICNIVKCRPPGNRDPEGEEIAACQPFLIQQIKAVRPKVIVALGRPAASTLMGRKVAITRERGSWNEFMGIPLMLTFHPAYLLRAYTLENRRAVQDDMNQVLNKLNQ